MMPDLLEKYEAECKKHAQERAEEGRQAEAAEKDEGGKEGGNTESDDEEKISQTTDSTKKRVLGPRKKFPWDNNIRSLLHDVVRVKMHTFQMSRTRSQTAEEFCKAFLDQDVRPLWPKGWMQTRALYKESKPAHALWTNPQKSKKALLLAKSVSPSVSSTSPGNKTSVAMTTLPTMNGSKVSAMVAMAKTSPSTKSSSVFVSNSKPASNSLTSSPISAPKKVVPTLLDYAENSSGTNTSVKTVSPSKSMPQTGAMNLSINSSSPGNTDPKVPTTEKWDHIVSDILRNSLSEQVMKSASPISSNQKQSFHSQFETFTANLISQGIVGQKGGTPNQQIANQFVLQQLQQKKQQLQQLAAKAQSAGAKPLTNKPTVKRQENQYSLKPQGNQSVVKLPENKSGFKPQSNQSAAKPQGSQSGMKMQTGNQPRPPNPSPMSLAMAKSITSGKNATKVTPKQLVNQFTNDAHKATVSLLTENFIQQQLSAAASMSSPVVTVQSRAAPKPVQSPGSSQHGQISPSADILRKTSPQAQAINLQARNTTSQVKPTTQIIKVTSAPGQTNAQTAVFHKGSNLVVTTDSAAATQLLKTLFGQAQSHVYKTTTLSDTGLQQQALLQAQARSTVGQTSPKQPQPQWSQGSSKSSPPLGRASYPTATDNRPKPYVVPITSSRPVPGYQSVKLSNINPQTFPAAPQAHRNAESGIYGNQMVSRPSPDGAK